MQRRHLIQALGLGSLTSAWPAFAEAFPSRPITLVSPWAAGGTNDLLCRLLAREAGGVLGQPMVVDNKPGASGVVGTTAVARSKPDGYTLTLGSTPGYATAPALYPNLPYDPLKDFTPIIGVATVPNVLVVPPSLPVNSVQELIAYIKARPGQVAYASVGNGSTQHLCAKLFERMTGTEMIHVPYKGTAPAMQDLLAGRVTLAFENMPPLLPQIRSGALKALAVTSAQRVAQLPDTPTLAASGLADFGASVWYAVFAPAERLRARLAPAGGDDAARAAGPDHAGLGRRGHQGLRAGRCHQVGWHHPLGRHHGGLKTPQLHQERTS